MHYREIPHTAPAPGVELPAFIVSEYSSGDFLLFSHGSFDIWCVYHAIRVSNNTRHTSSVECVYPLKLDTIKVQRVTGTKTDFTASFMRTIDIEYDGRVPRFDYQFDAPEDVEYLQGIRYLATAYGCDRVWNSFLMLYDSIPQQRGVKINRGMTQTVNNIVLDYPTEPQIRLIMDCLLCAMIAENNRLKIYGSPYNTKLGKKVKALGVYQAIYERHLSIRQVADYSKHKSWRWISAECYKRSIFTPDFD